MLNIVLQVIFQDTAIKHHVGHQLRPQPAPTGSVWQNISSAGNGMSLKVKTYSAALDVWVPQVSNVYANDAFANYTLDPTGGGRNIPVGTTYVQYNTLFYVDDLPLQLLLCLKELR
jgi:hypothetical protein